MAIRHEHGDSAPVSRGSHRVHGLLPSTKLEARPVGRQGRSICRKPMSPDGKSPFFTPVFTPVHLTSSYSIT
jgi:hypothetical protein